MSIRLRFLAAALAACSLIAAANPALAQSRANDKNDKRASKTEKRTRRHASGKALLGERIKKNGNHKLEDRGKFSASTDVSNGKITHFRVRHAEKGDVPVTKYKTNKKMAVGPTGANGVYPAQMDMVVTLWIGYAYIDDYGEEIIYWFPIDLIADGDTGAIEYYDYETS
jgi:hypothetical protein